MCDWWETELYETIEDFINWSENIPSLEQEDFINWYPSLPTYLQNESKGLTKKAIENLLEKLDFNTNDCCAICKENFQKDDAVLQLNCKHYFHKMCITPWLESNSTCPICRKEQSISTENNPEQPIDIIEYFFQSHWLISSFFLEG